jgi:hypothetical protein
MNFWAIWGQGNYDHPWDDWKLFGRLNDSLSDRLIFDEQAKVFTPSEIIAATDTQDNRNGYAPKGTVTLSYSYINSQTSTHSHTAGVKTGIAWEFQADATIFGIGGKATTKFNVEVNYSYTNTSSTTTSKTLTASKQLELVVPTGRIRKAVLKATVQKLEIPYSAYVHIDGVSRGSSRDDMSNFDMPIGLMFKKIHDGRLSGWEMYSSATPDDSDGGRRGLVAVKGKVTAEQTVNFYSEVWDVTDCPDHMNARLQPGEPADVDLPGATLIYSEYRD